MPAEVRQAIADILDMDNLMPFDLMRTLGYVTHLIEQGAEAHMTESALSVARVRLLMRLLVAERIGKKISPTTLSHYHRVNLNTISALLDGLENQGLIERARDPNDRRRVLIQLTEAGRTAALEHAPRLAAHASELFSIYTPQERETLLHLLGKLRDALEAQIMQAKE